MLKEVMDHPTGRIIISILLGLGLASLFRKVCSGKHCVVVNGPNMAEIKKYYYKIDQDCFKYTPVASQCEGSDQKGTGV